MEKAQPHDIDVLARSRDLEDPSGIVGTAAVAAGLKPAFAA